jgi:hypothetical protein
MMRYCEARARDGKPGVIGGFENLEMGATLSGVQLYEKCEYKRSGREDVFRCKNGEGIRIVHMTKDLESSAFASERNESEKKKDSIVSNVGSGVRQECLTDV